MRHMLVALATSVVLASVSAAPAFAGETFWYGDGVNEVTAAQEWVHSVHHRIFQDNEGIGAAGAPVCEALTKESNGETVQYACGYGKIYQYNGNCFTQVWAWAQNNYARGGPAMRVYGDGKTCP